MSPSPGQIDEPVPFFQPIVSVASGRIFAYEALGRQVNAAGTVKSLGSFFHDPDVPLTRKISVDRIIRLKALEKFRDELSDPNGPRLFLNINPQWLHRHKVIEDTGTLPTIRMLDELGLDGSRLVIEITEEELFTEYEDVIPLLDQYRERGIKIAIDDFYFQHFDRLIELKPDIVKLDLRLLRKSVENPDYQKLVNTISAFSQAIGVSVLFEGIENPREMEAAIAASASHAQGYLFSPAAADFQDEHRFGEIIRSRMETATDPAYRAAQEAVRLERYMNAMIQEFLKEESVRGGTHPECDRFLGSLGEIVPSNCFRMYVCDDRGVQQSSNYHRDTAVDPFHVREHFAGSRWSWRPYFIEGLIRMQENRLGVISDRYIDVEARKGTITFSYPLSERLFLFLDFGTESD